MVACSAGGCSTAEGDGGRRARPFRVWYALHVGADRVILVVEDDVAIRATLTEFLSGEGYLVDEAADGVEGLARIEARRPHLIVLDLHMPVMGGRPFLERLRGAEATRDIPVVLMTAASLGREPLGRVDAVLAKPFQLDDLVAAVERLAGRA
jgi:two-component system, OmpR family, response regulator MprA